MNQTTQSRVCRRGHGTLSLPVILLGGFLLVSAEGCRLPGLCGPEPGAPTPADFNGETDPENSGRLTINEFFDDPGLTQLMVEGLAQNQELKIRNQDVQIAYNEIMARRGAYLPMVGLGARGGFEKNSRYTPWGAAEEQLLAPGGQRFPNPLTNTRVTADLVWHVDIWKQFRNAQAAATERYVETVEDRNYLITRIVADIAENYYELAALDKRLEYLEQTIDLQKQSLEVANFQKEAARGTELGVQRFLAEVRKNESQRLIVRQSIIETENQINFQVGRYPQAVDRKAWDFISLDSRPLKIGLPADLLLNRRDILAAEREVAASGLDVLVARANFYPKLDITARVGFEAFNPRYLFDPGAFIAGAAGELVAPLINRKAIQAEYLNANARQLQAIYNYQRTVLNAFTEVVNSIAKVENYRKSVAIKLEQVQALEKSVSVATDLFQGARPEVEYMDVLFAQRDLLEARTVLIETKQQQLAAIVSTYQALGGGSLFMENMVDPNELPSPLPIPAPQQPEEVIDPAVPPAPEGTANLNRKRQPTSQAGRATIGVASSARDAGQSRAAASASVSGGDETVEQVQAGQLESVIPTRSSRVVQAVNLLIGREPRSSDAAPATLTETGGDSSEETVSATTATVPDDSDTESSEE